MVAAALVGAALAAAGVVFQALLRNPLATPDTLGVPRGPALGAMLAITFHLDFQIAGLPSIPLASLAGSLFALAVVYALAAGRRRGLSTTVLLLAGVTMTGFLLALTMFTQYLANFTDTFGNRTVADGNARRGELRTDPDSVLPILLIVSFAMFTTLPRALDLISLGADAAAARGVNVQPRPADGARSAHRSPPARRCRSADPSGSSAWSSHTWSGCSSARITGWCCRPRRCSGRSS